MAPFELARLRIERGVGFDVCFVGWSSFASDLVKEAYQGVLCGHDCLHETSTILPSGSDVVVREKIRKQEVRYEREARREPVSRDTAVAYFTDPHIA